MVNKKEEKLVELEQSLIRMNNKDVVSFPWSMEVFTSLRSLVNELNYMFPAVSSGSDVKHDRDFIINQFSSDKNNINKLEFGFKYNHPKKPLGDDLELIQGMFEAVIPIPNANRPFNTTNGRLLVSDKTCSLRSKVLYSNSTLEIEDLQDPFNHEVKLVTYNLKDLEYVILTVEEVFSTVIYLKGLVRMIELSMDLNSSSFNHALTNEAYDINQMIVRTLNNLRVDITLKFKGTYGTLKMTNVLDQERNYAGNILLFLKYLLSTINVVKYKQYPGLYKNMSNILNNLDMYKVNLSIQRTIESIMASKDIIRKFYEETK